MIKDIISKKINLVLVILILVVSLFLLLPIQVTAERPEGWTDEAELELIEAQMMQRHQRLREYQEQFDELYDQFFGLSRLNPFVRFNWPTHAVNLEELAESISLEEAAITDLAERHRQILLDNPDVRSDLDREFLQQQQDERQTGEEAREELMYELKERQEYYQERIGGHGSGLPDLRCSWRRPTTWFDGCLIMGVHSIIELFNEILFWIVNLAGNIFDWALGWTVLDFKEFATMESISDSWTLARDLANILFVFILLYLSISIILQISGVDIKKIITLVIIIALLINFSAFFTRTLIDVSNMGALTFYNQITQTTEVEEGGIAHFIKSNSGQDKLQGVALDTGQDRSDRQLWVDSIIKNILLALFSVVLFFILLTSGVLFLVRAMIFLILIILSPLAFMGYAIPKIKTMTIDKWWDQMLKWMIFAPVFMFLLYVSMLIISQLDQLAISGAGVIHIFITFIISSGLLISCIIIPMKLGLVGAQTVGQWTGKGVGLSTFGVGARIGQSTIGWGARKLKDSEYLKNKGDTFGGKMAGRMARRLERSSFDVRNTQGMKKIEETASKQVPGLTVGKPISTMPERDKKKAKIEQEHIDWMKDESPKTKQQDEKETKELEKERDTEREKIETDVKNDLSANKTVIETLNKEISNLTDEMEDFNEKADKLDNGIPEKEKQVKILEDEANEAKREAANLRSLGEENEAERLEEEEAQKRDQAKEINKEIVKDKRTSDRHRKEAEKNKEQIDNKKTVLGVRENEKGRLERIQKALKERKEIDSSDIDSAKSEQSDYNKFVSELNKIKTDQKTREAKRKQTVEDYITGLENAFYQPQYRREVTAKFRKEQKKPEQQKNLEQLLKQIQTQQNQQTQQTQQGS